MDDKQFKLFLESIEAKASEILSDEAQAKSVSEVMKTALSDFGTQWKSSVEAEKTAREDAQKAIEELRTTLASTQSELEALKNESKIRVAADVLNSRMNFIEGEYSLSEAELALVGNEVKNLGLEEADFDSYKQKLAILFSHKSTASIAEAKRVFDEKIEEEVSKRLGTTPAKQPETSTTEQQIEFEAGAATIPNTSESASSQETLLEKVRKNFSVEVKL